MGRDEEEWFMGREDKEGKYEIGGREEGREENEGYVEKRWASRS